QLCCLLGFSLNYYLTLLHLFICSTWEEAVDYCRNKNYDLIRISSEMEQNTIATLVNTTNSSSVWLRLRQSRIFGFWFWIDETPLSYQNWTSGFPPQISSSHHCAVISKDNNFLWTSVSCLEKHPFICRSPLITN
uniref:C-type lectin domain-containing protein n=1 Tax=Erpetoichthys calabaricus TaxID=27687 RepID=A0A8C4RU84_ERPCA